MPEKPDVFICQNAECKNRFQKAEMVSIEEDGLLITKPSCPKCKSTDLVASSIYLVDSK
ncbi:MAG: hypothetical protein ACXAEU_17825 [Candidatus Hodarchaeales archaeon]|jgi:hypothetical protein